LRALNEIDLGDRREFYLTLRTVFTSRSEDLPVFDQVFGEFWRYDPESLDDDQEMMPGESEGQDAPEGDSDESEGESEVSLEDWNEAENSDEEQDVPGYSAEQVLRSKDFSAFQSEELEEIIRRSAGILGVDIEPPAVRILAERGRGTPRVVNRLLRRVRDHAQVRGDGRISESQAQVAMEALDIDAAGLDTTDRRLLAAIVQKFGSGPVGGAAVAAVIGEEVETIEDVYEPFLLQLGFLDRTSQGRVATESAREHLRGLGYEVPPPRRAERSDPGLWDGVTSEGRTGTEAS
jgi:hypothetical protein